MHIKGGTSDAHRVGLGIELEAATLEAAVASARSMPPAGWLDLNVSPQLLLDVPLVAGILRRELRPWPARFVLELAEHAPIEDYAALRGAIDAHGPGVDLAVDDAGAGFASLRHILELRPRFVKLDIGLVSGVDRDPARQAMIAGMVHFAAETDCVLVGEGVESEAERRALRRLRVSLGQGYLFGRPGAAEDLVRDGRHARG